VVHKWCTLCARGAVVGSRKPRRRSRFRVGRVSVYQHRSSWWVYYRDAGRPVRRKAGSTRVDAERVAARVNAQLAEGAPTLFGFVPVSVAALRHAFLDHHENVLRSAPATVCRYAAATRHLETFVTLDGRPIHAHEVRADRFAAHLREVAIAPNGHPNTAVRPLRDKGVLFILETCRSMYGYAAKRRHLPPYAGNPFGELPLDRFKIEDTKPVFVFDADIELAFLHACSGWALPIHATLAKTGLRPGELAHLLIEDVDLGGGWITVRGRPELGWRVKTGRDRAVPLVPQLGCVLAAVIGSRSAGPVFLREKLLATRPALTGTAAELTRICNDRCREAGAASRVARLKIARSVWRDAGAVDPDQVRISFVRVMRFLGRPDATCPKSWRHSFATLLQDANVDPLIRQLVLGHSPSGAGGLGMTAVYTHSRPETIRRQVLAALETWPGSLAFVLERYRGRSA
jgi:integrase